MTAALAALLVRSSLLLLLVWCAAAAVRWAGGSAAMRHMVWLVGLGALLLLPLLAALMPPLPLPILPAAAAPPPQIAAGPESAPAGIGDLVRFLYLAVAAGLLARLALGHYAPSRLWRRARPAADAGWTALLGEIGGRLAIRRPIALRIATGPAMPMTWGTLRPRVLLPAEAAGWTDERRRIVLLHELAHVARRDSLARAAAAIACALYWFHPMIWYASWRMRLEQEHACDDLVLALGAKASAYARNLLDIAAAFRPPPGAASLSVAMARTSELERRLRAIVGRGPRRRSSPRFAAGTGAGALLASLMLASVAPVAALTPTPTPPARPAAPQQPATPAPVHALAVPGGSATAPPARTAITPTTPTTAPTAPMPPTPLALTAPLAPMAPSTPPTPATAPVAPTPPTPVTAPTPMTPPTPPTPVAPLPPPTPHSRGG